MTRAYIQITLNVEPSNREQAGAVYTKYKQPFLATIAGAKSKELLMRDEDVQVLHGFDSRAAAENYLQSALFNEDVVNALTPYLAAEPEIRIYDTPAPTVMPCI
jgi:quinol monooxygenase YgiN